MKHRFKKWYLSLNYGICSDKMEHIDSLWAEHWQLEKEEGLNVFQSVTQYLLFYMASKGECK